MQSERSNVQILRNLRLSNEEAKLSLARGNHPFGACLVSESGEVISLMVNHLQWTDSFLDVVMPGVATGAKHCCDRWDGCH